jgi:hypothetical protein
MDCLQRALDHPIDEGNGIIAASTDQTDKAAEAVRSPGLTVPIGYIIRPAGTLAVSQYSSDAIGRLVWQDVLGLLRHFKKPST